MNQLLQNTIRLGRTISMVSTLVAMLLVSSTHGVFEECSEESVSQEIELVMGRRDQRQDKKDFDSLARAKYPVPQDRIDAKQATSRIFVAVDERANMNGSGSYLLV